MRISTCLYNPGTKNKIKRKAVKYLAQILDHGFNFEIFTRRNSGGHYDIRRVWGPMIPVRIPIVRNGGIICSRYSS